MLTTPILFQALVASLATLALASPTPTSSPSPDLDICAIPSFQWHVNSEFICCPGVVDMPQGDRSKAYCCVGAHIPANVIITTTQSSCATTVSLNPITEYSSKAREAATKYGVTYTRNVGVGNQTVIETATVGVTATTGAGGSSSVSTGGAGARKTAAAAVVVLGGALLGI